MRFIEDGFKTIEKALYKWKTWKCMGSKKLSMILKKYQTLLIILLEKALKTVKKINVADTNINNIC